MKRCWDHEPCSRPGCDNVYKLITSLIKAQEQQRSQDDALRIAIEGGTENGITFERTRRTSIASLETFGSGNHSFYTAHSLYQLAGTPTESNSTLSLGMHDFQRSTGSSSTLPGFSDPPATSSESLDSRIDMTHVTSQESRAAMDAGSQGLRNLHGPRIIA
jgi:hypothetical protein